MIIPIIIDYDPPKVINITFQFLSYGFYPTSEKIQKKIILFRTKNKIFVILIETGQNYFTMLHENHLQQHLHHLPIKKKIRGFLA